MAVSATILPPWLRRAKANAAIPCVVSCGVSTPEQVAAVARHGDGMAVGSVIVKLVAEYGREAVRPVADYVRKMKQSLEGLLRKTIRGISHLEGQICQPSGR